MRFLVSILILVTLPGCFATKKRCQRLFPPIHSTDTVVIETVRDSIAFRDTTIVVKLPGVTIIDSIFIEPGIEKSDTVTAETNLARAFAFYVSPRLFLTLEQKDTLIYHRLDSAIREATVWRDRYIQITNKEVVPEKYIPGLYKFSVWAWVGVLVFMLFLFLIRKLV